MIRGAIDLVTNDRVQGWLFSSEVSLRDRTVLAFVGRRCVGAGTLGVFRNDLKAAGLGDGYSGFAVRITLAGPAELSSIVIRLENSDLTLLQPETAVISAKVAPIQRQVA